jgi:hypothetical protein
MDLDQRQPPRQNGFSFGRYNGSPLPELTVGVKHAGVVPER